MKCRKAIATVAAVATMTSMLGMTAFATETTTPWNTNGGTATAEGEAWVQQPTIEVELPGDLAFGLNPLKLNVSEDTSTTITDQILCDDFFVTNYSNIAVAVTAKTFVSSKSDKVDLLTDAAWNTDTDELNPSSTDGNKNVWLVQLYPDSIATADSGITVTYDTFTAGTTDAAAVKGDTLKVSTDGSDLDGAPIFVLKPWDEATVGNQKDSMAAFKFGGAVDPNATFEDGDIKVKTIFELETLTESQRTTNYEAYEAIGGTATTCATIMQEKTAGTGGGP